MALLREGDCFSPDYGFDSAPIGLVWKWRTYPFRWLVSFLWNDAARLASCRMDSSWYWMMEERFSSSSMRRKTGSTRSQRGLSERESLMWLDDCASRKSRNV